jgi:hypothetical protein
MKREPRLVIPPPPPILIVALFTAVSAFAIERGSWSCSRDRVPSSAPTRRVHWVT